MLPERVVNGLAVLGFCVLAVIFFAFIAMVVLTILESIKESRLKAEARKNARAFFVNQKINKGVLPVSDVDLTEAAWANYQQRLREFKAQDAHDSDTIDKAKEYGDELGK